MRRWIRHVLAVALPLLALVSAGCGGGDGDNGSNGGGGDVRVVISPSSASLPLNSSFSFVGSVLGGPTTAIVADTGAVRAANVVTITTTAPHGLTAGQRATVLGVTNVTFIGTFTVATVPSSTSFTYAQTGPDATSGGGTVANVTVNWLVNDVPGGNATVGTITSAGLYTAPATLPAPVTATIAANGAARSSNVVTITTTAAHNFVTGQIVTISGVTDSSFNGTFVVAGTPSETTFVFSQSGTDVTSGNGSITSTAVQVKATAVIDPSVSGTAVVNISSGVSVSVSPETASVGTDETFTYMATVTTPSGVSQDVTWEVTTSGGGTIVDVACPAGTASNVRCGQYTAPATVPTSPTVTIKATAVADTSRSDTATATIVTAADPTLASIIPGFTAQGSLFQDIHLTGTNFLSTSRVLLDGSDADIQVTFINGTLLRARIGATRLATAGMKTIDVQRQDGTLAMSSQSLTVEAVRPALVSTAPDSVREGSAATVTVNVNGGYFSGTTVAQFNGGPAGYTPSMLDPTRQLSAPISIPTDPGLYSLTLQNSNVPAFAAGVNLAVQPDPPSGSSVTTPVIGNQPVAVAINTATGMAVVANRGSNNVAIIEIASPPAAGPLPTCSAGTPTNCVIAVGPSPTGVAVDNARNLAVVANNGDDTISIIDLGAVPPAVIATLASPTPAGASGPAKPVSAAVNPLTGLAVVANENTNAATVIDLETQTVFPAVSGVSTGPNPSVAVEPRLNWAVITPGGGGAVTILDMGRRAVVATVALGQSVRGIGINTETERAFLVNPADTMASIFSVLDQSVASFALESGQVAAAVNPLTDIGVSVNATSNQAYLVDLRTPQFLTAVPVGAGPVAVAIDPGSNTAVIANETDGTLTLLSLGSIRVPQITEINPASICVTASAPAAGCVAPSDTTLTVTGFGFDSGSTVRLDGAAVTTTFVSSRQVTATVPAAMLGSARRYVVQVENSSGLSNVVGLSVLQAVTVGTAPLGVAIDPQLNVALVANSGSDDVSLVDLATGAVTDTVTVGDNPQAVAVLSRKNRAVVTNRADDSVSILDIDPGAKTAAQTSTVSVGTEPTGVAVNPDTGEAVVANFGGNSVSVVLVGADNPTVSDTLAVDAQPGAVAFDPTRNLAAVANESGNTIAFVSLAGASPSIRFRSTGIQLPTSVAFDPASDRFLVVAGLTNNLFIVDPDTGQLTQARVGINPTSLAYNFHSGTLVTLNTASQTMSLMDFQDRRIRAILPVGGSDRFALAIHPRTNLAVVSDSANDRILLVPLPR